MTTSLLVILSIIFKLYAYKNIFNILAIVIFHYSNYVFDKL